MSTGELRHKNQHQIKITIQTKMSSCWNNILHLYNTRDPEILCGDVLPTPEGGNTTQADAVWLLIGQCGCRAPRLPLTLKPKLMLVSVHTDQELILF